MRDARNRVFLFLQGPHGPFFHELARRLIGQGAQVHRASFNAGDEAEWAKLGNLHRFDRAEPAFGGWLIRLFATWGITDIVLYGDTRPVHDTALSLARARRIRTHCFEEGYVRPNWITYERPGNNGNSPLMSISLPGMARAVGPASAPEELPATWGASRQHLWHSVRYHIRCLIPSRRYQRFRGHRDLALRRECATYLLRALLGPWIRLKRGVQQWRLLRSGKRFHLVLLQLSFDASMQVHSDYRNTTQFVADVIDAFAQSAGARDHLVFKAHPFEDGRERLGRTIRDLAHDLGVSDRVIFIDGGKKLASLLDRAGSAITVNSTAAQQALWRGLPVAALGRAIYRKPGLVSEQTLRDFLRGPRRSDLRSYWLFRHFLMATSQITGSFYSARGRRVLLAQLPARMLDPLDAYERVGRRCDPVDIEALARPALIVAR